MKYKQAINGPDLAKWRAEIDSEHDHMVKNKVFEAVKRENLPPGTKVIDSIRGHTITDTGHPFPSLLA